MSLDVLGQQLSADVSFTRDGATTKTSVYELFDRDGKVLASVADKGREVRAVARRRARGGGGPTRVGVVHRAPFLR